MSEAKTMTFLVFRQKDRDAKPYYDRFKVPIKKGMTVLDALFYIQNHLDSTLAFRYACRGAICGSCAMTIDKFPQLACRTQVLEIKSAKKPPKIPALVFGDVTDWNEEEEILIEPLPNMAVLKDLVVDMDSFWEFYKKVQPYFTRAWKDTAPESTQQPEQAKKIESLIYCILCGICWTCPVTAKNPHYIGPAALAKAYRFLADSRVNEKHKKEILEVVSQEDGVPACEEHYVCNRLCPKNVRPGTAIRSIRKEWITNE